LSQLGEELDDELDFFEPPQPAAASASAVVTAARIVSFSRTRASVTSARTAGTRR
jgi:hypothetical protein